MAGAIARARRIRRDVVRSKHYDPKTRLHHMLARFVDGAPFAIFVIRHDRERPLVPPVVYANDAFYRLTGYTREEHARGNYPRILGPDTDIALVMRSIGALQRGESVRAEVKLYRKDGSPFWADVQSHTLAKDAPVHCLLAIREITDRRAEEDRMSILSEAVDHTQEFVKVVDSTPAELGGPRIVYVNSALLQSIGYTEAEIVGQRYDVAYSPKNDRKVLDAISSTMSAGGANFREVLVRRKDGSDFWVEFIDRPFVNRHGEPMRISIGRDITLRKRAFNQVSLLFAAMAQSPDRLTLYEIGENGELAVSFENAQAAAAGRARLLELLAGKNKTAREIRRKLEVNDEIYYTFADTDAVDRPVVVHFSAHAVRNGERIEAVLTRERDVTPPPISARGDSSPLLKLALMLPALHEAATSAERFTVLRALLLDHFGAEANVDESGTALGVQIDARARKALFPYGKRTVRVSWGSSLEAQSITALRFCIETALELERLMQ